jgi:hypothetical protein
MWAAGGDAARRAHRAARSRHSQPWVLLPATPTCLGSQSSCDSVMRPKMSWGRAAAAADAKQNSSTTLLAAYGTRRAIQKL